MRGDAVSGAGLDEALDGIDVAYYLIHSMEGPAASFEEQELRAARQLGRFAAEGGVRLQLRGLRPSALDYLAWLAGRRAGVRMLTTRSTAGVFQAWGRRQSEELASGSRA